MAVRSGRGQASTSTPSDIHPTSSTCKCEFYNASTRASGVSKTMWNRSKAHHQSSTNPGHDSSSVAFQEVRFGRPRVAFSRNTRTKISLDVGQLPAFPVALRTHIHFLCAACESGTPSRRFALARGAYNTEPKLWQRDNINDKVASAVGQLRVFPLVVRTHINVFYITPERFMPIHRVALEKGPAL
jgi:hypothetical protein